MGRRPNRAAMKIVGADIFTGMDARSVILSRRSACDGVSKDLAPPIFWRRDSSGSCLLLL
jgi:hypothetical protein